jgi:hypothetical protein
LTAHFVPQLPQLSGSVFMSTHATPASGPGHGHCVKPDPGGQVKQLTQMHMVSMAPPAQHWPGGVTFPQTPQLNGSSAVATHPASAPHASDIFGRHSHEPAPLQASVAAHT